MSFETNGATDYSVGSDEHDTPMSLFAPISEIVGGFDLDPCASETSELASRNIEKEEDGLSVRWSGDVWLNPPYSEVSEWLQYARSEYEHGSVTNIVALVYARTSTKWFHNHVTTAELICFIEGRLTFGEGEYNAPAPNILAVWGPAAENHRLVEHLADLGLLCRPEFGSYTTQKILWGIQE